MVTVNLHTQFIPNLFTPVIEIGQVGTVLFSKNASVKLIMIFIVVDDRLGDSRECSVEFLACPRSSKIWQENWNIQACTDEAEDD